MEKIISNLTDTVTDAALRLLFAVIIIGAGMKLSKWLAKKFLNIKVLKNVDAGVLHFLSSAIKIALYVLVFISAAIILGIPATSFITILGSAGLAIGLALQGSLSNLAGSLMILIFKPFKIGDFIECDTIKGTVEDINLFYTVLHTLDNRVITCPNGTLSNKDIINYSAKDMRRVDMKFSVGYKSDIDKVREILLTCAESDSRVLKSPEPVVYLTEYGESSLDFDLRMWCNSDDYWNVYYNTMETVKKAFELSDIEIPYKQVDIHLKR